jgi:hypothetical protein
MPEFAVKLAYHGLQEACRMSSASRSSWRRGGIVLFFTILAGCATTADIESAKSTWQGATYDEVVARWGTPVRQTSLTDGSQVYTWITEASSPYSGTYGSIGVFGGSGGGGSGVGVGIGLPLPGFGGGGGEIQRCERTLTFRNGRATEQLWQGQPGLCSTLGR